MENCIFCKIAKGEIPTEKLYEDERVIVFKDISPQSKLHLLMIPKKHFDNISEWALHDSEGLAISLQNLTKNAEKLGFSGGFRLVTNNGSDARQSVNHVHIHMLGGQKLSDKMG